MNPDPMAGAVLVGGDVEKRDVRPIEEHVESLEARLDVWRSREFIGLPQRTLKALDTATCGLRGLMLLAAAPNVGKTVLAMQLGLDVVRNNSRSDGRNDRACFVFISLEMSKLDILTRILCSLSGLPWRTVVFGSGPHGSEPAWGDGEAGFMAAALAEMRDHDFGGRVVVADAGDLGDTVTAQSVVSLVNQTKARTGATRAYVAIDYLQVWPVSGANAHEIRSDLDSDKWRIGAMREIRDSLPDDAILVISEARKPSGNGGKKGEDGTDKDKSWGGDMSDVMGSARLTYTPDMVFLLQRNGTESDVDEENGIAPYDLGIRKGRDGVTRTTIKLDFMFRASRFVPRPEQGR